MKCYRCGPSTQYLMRETNSLRWVGVYNHRLTYFSTLSYHIFPLTNIPRAFLTHIVEHVLFHTFLCIIFFNSTQFFMCLLRFNLGNLWHFFRGVYLSYSYSTSEMGVEFSRTEFSACELLQPNFEELYFNIEYPNYGRYQLITRYLLIY